MRRWMIILAATLVLSVVSGCATRGPIGSEGFDPNFTGVVEEGEKVLYYAQSRVHVGSFMEGKMRSFPQYQGVVIMTEERLIFTMWQPDKLNYHPMGWILYRDIRRIKKHNNILLQYIALVGPDDSKNAYHMSAEDTEKVHAILVERVKHFYNQPSHNCKNCISL